MQNSTTTTKEVKILDELVLISLSGTRIFSGRRKLTKKDLGSEVATKLPPDSLTSLGVIRTCDSKQLAPFASARSAAEQMCLQVGTRFLGGFAMTLEAAKETMPKLQSIKGTFYANKPAFLADYQDKIDAWANSHQEWRHLIDEHVHPLDYVDNNLHFDYSCFKVGTLGDDGLDANLLYQAGGLSNQILNEVASSAKTFQKVLMGKAELKLTLKGVNPIRSIRTKLNSLSMIDAKVAPIIQMIDETLARLPKDGMLDGINYMAVSWLTNLMTNPSQLKNYGQMILDGKSAKSIVDENVVLTDEQITESEPNNPESSLPVTQDIFESAPQDIDSEVNLNDFIADVDVSYVDSSDDFAQEEIDLSSLVIQIDDASASTSI